MNKLFGIVLSAAYLQVDPASDTCCFLTTSWLHHCEGLKSKGDSEREKGEEEEETEQGGLC